MTPTRSVVEEALRFVDLARSEGVRVALSRFVDVSRAYAMFRRTTHGRRILATGRVRVHAAGRVVVGDLSQFAGGMIPTQIICHAGAELVIGEQNDWNYGVHVEARHRVTIGDRVLLGSMVRISDSLHGRTAPIVIGDGVWIAHGAVIEPGVTVGEGSVVSAGSVVTRDVPPRRFAIGNPARALPLSVARVRG